MKKNKRNSKLNQQIADDIRILYKTTSIKQWELAEKYGVSSPAISLIITNKHFINTGAIKLKN